MSGSIFLIVEDENDGEVIKDILKKRNLPVKVEIRKPTGGSGGISRLAKQLKELITTAKKQKKLNDCIAVLHDDDVHKQTNRDIYEQIKFICEAEGVKEVIARDELEAWVLADSGLCDWLGIKQKPWDKQEKPSDELRSLLQKKGKLSYQGKGRAQVISHLNGDGDQYSPSMREALQHLDNAPCVRL